MKKRKLRGFVLPTLYLLIIGAIFVGVNYLGKSLNNNEYDTYNFVLSAFKNNIVSVAKEQQENVIKPYVSESVEQSIGYYDVNAEETAQQNALIYYEKTYMENTGVLYTSKEKFDAIATMDGTVKNIKEDEILGVVVEIQNTSKVTTIYYSLGELNVSVGDKINQGDVIGTSGTNKLDNKNENSMLFEVYIDGALANPEQYYSMKISELN